MTGYLLDTNVVSELRRPRPSANVLGFIRKRPAKALFVSVVTMAEIRSGIECLDDASRRADFNDWLAHIVRPMFADRVLAVDEEVMLRWRLLVEVGRKAGRTCAQPDLILAATAAHHGLTVVSRDTIEFEHAGVPVVDPWTEGLA